MQIQDRCQHFKIKESNAKIARISFFSFLSFFLFLFFPFSPRYIKASRKFLAFNIFFMHLNTFSRYYTRSHRAHNIPLYANMYIPYKASQDYIHKFFFIHFFHNKISDSLFMLLHTENDQLHARYIIARIQRSVPYDTNTRHMVHLFFAIYLLPRI